jgi:hypothetical protein
LNAFFQLIIEQASSTPPMEEVIEYIEGDNITNTIQEDFSYAGMG